MECPIKPLFEQVVEDGTAFIKSLRELRVQMDECTSCKYDSNCAIRKEFHVQINAAILEVCEEWGLM
ncbi:hypothetical protein LCGC14_0705790 [marine sediment metagenome]|uniref:Uncharacterized protein n=1 Tax=marine sediment metagenome TaxID=412755 RepID=A0A0F9TP61_9ZZZZ|nr:hypothetical protein [bacterium]